MNAVYAVNHVNWQMDLQQSLCHIQFRWLLADAIQSNNGFVWCMVCVLLLKGSGKFTIAACDAIR